jgi:hypothetical protein
MVAIIRPASASIETIWIDPESEGPLTSYDFVRTQKTNSGEGLSNGELIDIIRQRYQSPNTVIVIEFRKLQVHGISPCAM